MPEMLVFGAVRRDATEASRKPLETFARALGEEAEMDFAVLEAETYEDLASSMHKGDADVAWLPPIPFIALERRGIAEGLVSQHRGGSSEFHAVVIVHAASSIRTPADLRGKRAAWVDPYSASGYVVPRVELDALGVDVRTAFSVEKFHHSHEDVVRAVVSRAADFGGTYAGLDAAGTIIRGSWLDAVIAHKSVRVLMTFSAIPGDVIAARHDLPKKTRDKVTRGLVAVARNRKHRMLVKDFFGSDDFRRWLPAGYDRLRELTSQASKKGLLEGREHG